jgi:hypothetical protein
MRMRIWHSIPVVFAAVFTVVNGLPQLQQRTEETNNPNCFPFGSSRVLSLDLRPPPMSRSEWWCAQDMFYGFLGFSYAFQYTNMDFDVATISKDMVRMKQEFGATMIRMYIPESYTTELWENVIQAAIENNMGIVTQVAFPISGNDVGLPEHFIITIILFLPRLENYLTNFIAVMGSGPGVYPIPSAREQSIFCNRPICHLRS